MNLYVDLATRRIVFSPKLNKELARVDVKRGDVYPLTIVFLSNGKPTQIAAGSVIAFCAKKKNDFDADPLVLSNSFTLSGAGTDDPKYNGVIQLNGVDLNDYLDNVSDKADDLVFADLHSEINWSAGGVSLTTNTLILRVYNDIYKDGDGDPELIVGQPFVFPNGLKIPSLTTGNVVLVGTDGLLQDISRSGIDTRSSFPPSSHAHGNITNDGKIGTTSDLVVITTTAGSLTTSSRSGIDTRTSFPNDDVFNATTTGTPSQLLRLNSAGNAVANIFVALEGIEIGEEGGDAGFIRILNANGDVVTLNNANASNAEISLPTESGTLALTTDIVDSVTSATTSDGTANLSISNVTTATATVSSLLTANHIHGNIAGTLYTHVRTGEAVSKGDPVYVSGFHNGTGQAIVRKADASDAGKMPAIGVMDAAYSQNVSGANCVIAGTITSVDTYDFSINSPVYVGNGGGFSETIGTIPQQVGIVERSNQNNGAFVVTNNKVISSADISDFASAVEAIAPNAVTSATTSDGTANLAILTATVGSALVVGDGDSVKGRYDIFANTNHFQWYSDSALYGEREFVITTENLISSGSLVYKYPSASGTFAVTASTTGVPDKLTDGTIAGTLAINTTSYTYGTGAAAAHRTALGLSTLATTTPAVNVATFLETPTSANLAAAVTGETGTGSLVFGTSPSLTSPTIGTSATFNATTYTYGAGAAAAHRTALGLGTIATQAASNVAITGGTAAFTANSSVTGYFTTQLSGSTTGKILLGAIAGSGRDFPGVWFGNNTTTPSTSNYGFLYDSAAGTILNTPSGQSFFLRVGNTNALTIDSTLGVGIGTTTPAPNSFWEGGKTLHILDQASNLPNLRFQSSLVDFTFACDNGAAYFYLATNHPQRFYTNAAERMRLTGSGELGIGTTSPSTKAILDLTSTTKGFLPPRMTTTQRNAITSVPAGLMVYNTALNKLNFYNGTTWETVTSL